MFTACCYSSVWAGTLAHAEHFAGSENKNREPCNCTIRMYLMATAIYLLYVCYCFVPAADCVRG